MIDRIAAAVVLSTAFVFSYIDDSSLHAAVITHVGTDMATEDRWRTTDYAKPLDFNNDNIYGTDGYFVTFAALLNPPTICDVTYLGPASQNSVFHALVDDPTETGPGPVTDVSGGNFFYTGIAAGAENDFFQIELLQNISFRMAILNDIGSFPEEDPESAVQVRVRQTVGGSANSGLINVSSSLNNAVDYYLFDISGVAGDTFIVSGVNDSIVGDNALAGLAFDYSAVPEPSPLALTLLGTMGYGWFTRRRARRENQSGAD